MLCALQTNGYQRKACKDALILNIDPIYVKM